MKKKKRSKARFKILLALLALAFALLFLMFAPIFNIKYIEVIGSEKYTDEEIIAASGIRIGDNGFRKLKITPESLFEFRILDSEEGIKRLSYVNTCKVSIVFPDKVLIKITDRKPAAYLVYFDNFITVDEQGFVLEAAHSKPVGDLKEIRGIDFSRYVLGGQLETSNITLIRVGVDIINAINRSDENSDIKLADVLDWVDIINENDAMLSLDNRVIVRFDPKDKLQYYIDFTKEIFFKKISTQESGRLEFSGDQNPSFIPD
jgi:cell division protein FtsQ